MLGHDKCVRRGNSISGREKNLSSRKTLETTNTRNVYELQVAFVWAKGK